MGIMLSRVVRAWRATRVFFWIMPVAVWPAPGAWAQKPTHPLNDTGAKYCLVSGFPSNACMGTSQDAGLGRDVSPKARDSDGHAGFRFEKICHSGEAAGQGSCPKDPALGSLPSDWGCTRDRLTQLIWELKTDDGGWRDQNRTYTFIGDGRTGDASKYLKRAQSNGLCGARDWRLPGVVELLSMVDFGVSWPGPTLDTRWFPNSLGQAYWTSEPLQGSDMDAWIVQFYGGAAFPDSRWHEHVNGVRLVRGGRPATMEPRFVPNTAGDEVRDTATGLVWRRCTEGQHWNGSRCKGSHLPLSWAAALSRAASEADRTGQTWRMPNIKELQSLVQITQLNPAIDPVAFPDTVVGPWYWSSTPYADPQLPYMWGIYFGDGEVLFTFTDEDFHTVRLVREGH